MPPIGQAADLTGQELAAAAALAQALLGFGGDADGTEFVAVAVQPAGQAQAQDAGVELVGLAPAVEGQGRDEKGLGTGADQLAVEHEAKAAGLLHAEDLESLGDASTDVGDQLLGGELARRLGVAVVLLPDGHDELQMHIQAQLEHRLVGIEHRGGQGLARR